MLSSQDIDLIETIFSQHRNMLGIDTISRENDIKLAEYIQNSLLLASYKNIRIHESFSVSCCNTDTFLFIIRVNYPVTSRQGTYYISELQLIGLKMLDRDFGHIIIRPETFEDKINEFFKKCEIDFNGFPDFSSRYYFLAKEETSGIFFATSDRLKLIERQNDILIEVKGDILISKYPRILNPSDFSNLLNFIKEV